MSDTKPLVIHRVSALDLVVEAWTWPFAEARRAEIAAHFADQQREKPALWNGRVLLGRNPVFSGDRLSASYFETDFASFLAWRDWHKTLLAVAAGVSLAIGLAFALNVV